MEPNQARIIELLREVHLIAFKEIERLNQRFAELESQDRQPIVKVPVAQRRTPSEPPEIEIMNEKQLAAYLNISVAGVRRLRLLRKGPKFIKIGSAVRYRREDVESWLASCAGTQ